MTVSEWFEQGMTSDSEGKPHFSGPITHSYSKIYETIDLLRDTLYSWVWEAPNQEKKRKNAESRSLSRRLLNYVVSFDCDDDVTHDVFSIRHRQRPKRRVVEPAAHDWSDYTRCEAMEWSRGVLSIIDTFLRNGLLGNRLARRFAFYFVLCIQILIKSRSAVDSNIQPARMAVTLRTIKPCAP